MVFPSKAMKCRVCITFLFVAAVSSRRLQEVTDDVLQEDTASDVNASFPTTKQARECEVCQHNWDFLKIGQLAASNAERVLFYYGTRANGWTSVLKTGKEDGDWKCPFEGYKAQQCEDLYLFLIHNERASQCFPVTGFPLDTWETFCGCAANRDKGPSCPSSTAAAKKVPAKTEVKTKEKKVVKAKTVKKPKAVVKVVTETQGDELASEQIEDTPQETPAGPTEFGGFQLQQCHACTERWKVFRKVVMNQGAGSSMAKRKWFLEGGMDAALKKAKLTCPQYGDCADVMVFLRNTGISNRCYNYEYDKNEDGKLFCGCVVSKLPKGKLCP